jgi:tetraacyldisaccharide 4'-kinase
LAVVSRGYGRESRGPVLVRKAGDGIKVGESQGGDEPLMLARALPNATVLVNDDRAVGGAQAVATLGAEAVILDDAFQYMKVVKDLDVLLIDARTPPGPTLPAGIYREGVGAARAADLIVFTKCRHGDYRERWKKALSLAHVGAPSVEAAYAPAYLRLLNQPERLALKNLVGAKVLALAAIADFEGFAADLTEAGAVVARRRPFPDHHRFGHAELADAEGTALVAGCDFIVTTAKDEARLEGWRPRVLTYVLEQQVEILNGFEILNQYLDRVVTAATTEAGRAG